MALREQMVYRLEKLWAECNYIVSMLLSQGHLKESELKDIIEERARLIT